MSEGWLSSCTSTYGMHKINCLRIKKKKTCQTEKLYAMFKKTTKTILRPQSEKHKLSSISFAIIPPISSGKETEGLENAT